MKFTFTITYYVPTQSSHLSMRPKPNLILSGVQITTLRVGLVDRVDQHLGRDLIG